MNHKKTTEGYLLNLSPEITVVAENNNLTINYNGSDNSINLSSKASWNNIKNLTNNGRILAQSVEQLIEMELATSDQNKLNIEYKALQKLSELELDFFSGSIPWAPFSILIQADGLVGTESFHPTYQFILGKQHSFPRRLGPFLFKQNTIYRLSPENYELIEEIDQFNSLPLEAKNKLRALECLAKIKDYTCDVKLDDYLNSEGVIIPQKVKVDIISEDQGFISLFPAFEGVPTDVMQKEFFRLSEVQSVYDLQTSPGKRLRVLIPPDMIPALKDIQKIRRVNGATKDRVIADLMSCFSDGTDKSLIDAIEFAPRVKGICSIPQRAQLIINTESRHWSGVKEDDSASVEFEDKPLSLRISNEDSNIVIPLSMDELKTFSVEVKDAIANDSAQIIFKGETILINDDLIKQINESESIISTIHEKNFNIIHKLKASQVLDIHQNFDSTSYSEGTLEKIEDLWAEPQLPKSLKNTRTSRNYIEEPFKLKRHQERGIVWLQNLFNNRLKRRGCLLADDMGLGKTLQILTFLAWCIESGYKKGLGDSSGPYEPILIISPIILLNNWQKEMEIYFQNDIFSPCQILYGSQIKKFTLTTQKKGRETKDGRQKLDIEKIRENRVIITNYDTVKNYQHSFAKIPWTVIITDEAQEFKVQNQKSDSLKALRAQFRIVATGTPVENRLLDLWNLVDFMHPGELLGSAKDFFNRYEKDINQKTPEEKKQLTQELRNSLFYDRPDAFVLRRDKENELTDLPKKFEVKIDCPMTDQLKQLHYDIVSRFNNKLNNTHHFTLIGSLKKLYLHPRLLNAPQAIEDPKSYIHESPKLVKLIELLTKIRDKREKVLIFAQSIALQSILAEILGQNFKLDIEIINGSSISSGDTMRKHRERAINDFESKEGFNILILSAMVAGVGLTITGANHVIHYERWWNPAKESQATDRAYRIGQKKDVYVYYLIATDPANEIITFDQKIDQLLAEKKELAKDFLVPRESEISENEVAQSLFESIKDSAGHQTSSNQSIIKTLEDIENLSSNQFIALIGLIYKLKGLRTILCPLTNNGGANILVISPDKIIYIQCKHSSSLNIHNISTINDLVEAPELYSRNVLPVALRRKPVIKITYTNSKFDQETKILSSKNSIELIEGKEIEKVINKLNINLVDILEFEAERNTTIYKIRDNLVNIDL